MKALLDNELDEVCGGGPFSDGDSFSIPLPGGASMTLGSDSMNRIFDAAAEMIRGPGPSAFSSTAEAPPFSATANRPRV